MRHGRVVEEGDARRTLDHPQHPYSIELRNAVLSPDVALRDGTCPAPPLDSPTAWS
jgi:ABC-type dipeptide/oligopeptide/nickel transport system ATPase component